MRVTQSSKGIRFLFVHCKIDRESGMGILHNDTILGCDFQVLGLRRKSRFGIKGDNAKSLLVFEKNALWGEPYCSIAPSGRHPPLGHVRSSSSSTDDDALRGYQNFSTSHCSIPLEVHDSFAHTRVNSLTCDVLTVLVTGLVHGLLWVAQLPRLVSSGSGPAPRAS